jgi:hypothetical protein
VWMHLDDTHVHIPSPIVIKSEVLMDASMCESSATGGFTLKAPTEWLHAWVACFVNEEEQLLRCAAREDLVNCLLVCSCSSITALSALTMSSSLFFDVALLSLSNYRISTTVLLNTASKRYAHSIVSCLPVNDAAAHLKLDSCDEVQSVLYSMYCDCRLLTFSLWRATFKKRVPPWQRKYLQLSHLFTPQAFKRAQNRCGSTSVQCLLGWCICWTLISHP